MYNSINFPNLGIELRNVGSSIRIFGFEIAYYGILIGFGILLAILLVELEAKRTGQSSEHYFDLAIWGVISGVIGSRVFFVIFAWDHYRNNLLSIFDIRGGGLAIYGAVIFSVATALIYTKRKQLHAPLVLDTGILGLLVGQIVGRWGNFFNRELFGEYTNNIFAMQIPIDRVRASDVTDLMRDNIVRIDNVNFIQVHPTFLYESLWNTAVLILLLVYIRRKKFDGEIFLLYLLGYGVGRFWIESIRTDQLLIPGLAIPVSQVVALFCVLVSLFFLIKNHRELRKTEILPKLEKK